MVKTNGEWISVDDALPVIGERVLIYKMYPDGYVSNVMEAVRYKNCNFNRFGADIQATHWMPLPEPPQQ